MFAWLLSGPLFCTLIWHYSVLEAGLAVTPGAFTSALAAIFVGKRCSPRGQRIAIPIGLIGFTITGLWMFFALGDTPEFLAVWLPVGLLGGASLGATLTGLSAVAALSLPPDRFATGMGMNTTARQVGGALGVAATAVLLTRTDVVPTQAFLDVFLLCGIAGLLAALAGSLLLRVPRSPGRNHAPAESPAPIESGSRHSR
jgi:MFS family permease